MSTITVTPAAQTDDDIAAAFKRITPQQRRTLERLDSRPWCWFVSDNAWIARLDRYDREAQRAYFTSISRVTTYEGPDYRVKFSSQRSWIRANKMQYEQALAFGMQRSIGVPDLDDLKALTA